MCRSSSNSKQYIFSKISFTINSEMNFVNQKLEINLDYESTNIKLIQYIYIYSY